MAEPSNPVRDPGLQPERTALAWTRTAAGVLLNALLALRTGLAADSAPFVAAGLLLTLAAGGIFGFGRHRAHALANGTAPVQGPAAALAFVALATAVAGLAGMLAVCSGAGHVRQ